MLGDTHVPMIKVDESNGRDMMLWGIQYSYTPGSGITGEKTDL